MGRRSAKYWYLRNQLSSIKVPNKFEQKIYGMLSLSKIKFIPQYEVDGKFYDAYLPEYNVLLELDGTFFHKESISECKYGIQKKNYRNDRVKDKIAKQNKYILIRIKESDLIIDLKKHIEAEIRNV